MFEKLLSRLPKKKTPEELDEHYTKMEQVELEKGDMTALLIAGFISLVLPLLLIVGTFYGVIYFIFIR
ncbi:MAG: hypothetical protein Q8S19_06895 [Bacillota bacterium]|nr:hypothetical protein [Bacillota bacterium]